jgi:hypothetical protein
VIEQLGLGKAARPAQQLPGAPQQPQQWAGRRFIPQLGECEFTVNGDPPFPYIKKRSTSTAKHPFHTSRRGHIVPDTPDPHACTQLEESVLFLRTRVMSSGRWPWSVGRVVVLADAPLMQPSWKIHTSSSLIADLAPLAAASPLDRLPEVPDPNDDLLLQPSWMSCRGTPSLLCQTTDH